MYRGWLEVLFHLLFHLTGQITPNSGLPQFSVAFGSWDSSMQATPPYTPNSTLRNPNALYGCPNPSPVAHATGFTRSLPTWQYTKCGESPPISPSVMYSPSLAPRPPTFQFQQDASSQTATQTLKPPNFWPCPTPTTVFGFHPPESSLGCNVATVSRIAGQSPTLTSVNE